MPLAENHVAELTAWLDEAKARMEALPKRIEAEAELARKERRQPRPITPLIEVRPSLLSLALAECKDAGTPALNETVGTLRRVCSEQNQSFAMLAEQLIAVLTLAGIKS